MLTAILAAAVVATPATPPKPVVTGAIDMTCGVDGAHLTAWRSGPAATRLTISADAKSGETVVIDRELWTATAKTTLALKPGQFAYQAVGGPDKPASAVLDCSQKNARPLRVVTVEFQ